MMAGPFAREASADDVQISPFEVQAYQDDFGVSPQIARDHLAVQAKGAGIVEMLKRILDEDYAGLWFDNDAGQFVVPVLPESKSAMVKSTIEDLGLAGDFRLEQASASWDELESVRDRAVDHLDDLSEDQVIKAWIDPKANAVVLQEAKAADASAESQIETIAETLPDTVISTSEEPIFDVETQACKTSKPRVCDKPLRGGVGIGPITPTGGGGFTYSQGECTAGFKALGNQFGNRFILTAGHCAAKFPGKKWASHPVNENILEIGPVDESTFGPTGDWAKINANGSQWDTASWPSWVAHYWENQSYPISFEAWAYPGQYLCFSGNKSGTSCGNVSRIGITGLFDEASGVHFPPLTEIPGICTEGGDSGGPLYSFSSNTAIGLLSAAEEGGSCAASLAYFTEITSATTAMGVSVGTRVGGPPIAATVGANNVQPRQVTANGTVNPNAVTTKYRFEFGTTTAYGQVLPVPDGDVGHGATPVGVAQTFTGLLPNETYHYRVSAISPAGASSGSDAQVTTLPVPPVVSTKAASSISGTAATLNASVNPEGAATKYFFEYGPTSSYGSKTAELSAGAGRSLVDVSAAVSELEFGANYHFRLVASSIGGTAKSADLTFTPGWRKSSIPLPSPLRPTSFLYDVDCISPQFCAAVGVGIGNFEGTDRARAWASFWDGQSWSSQLVPMASGTLWAQLAGIDCISATDCWAVGGTSTGGSASDPRTPLAAHWTNGIWQSSALTGPAGAHITALNSISCTATTSCIATGVTQPTPSSQTGEVSMRLNGSNWALLTNPPGALPQVNTFSGDCITESDCYTPGSMIEVQPQSVPFVNHWNGATWTRELIPSETLSAFLGLDCLPAGGCIAAGWGRVGGMSIPFVGKLSGGSWNPTALPQLVLPEDKGNYLDNISCTSLTNCEAIGRIEGAGGVSAPLAARIKPDGSWERQTVPPLASKAARIWALSCPQPTFCAVVGYQGSLEEPLGAIYSKFQAPIATTKPATGVNDTQATLNGTIDRIGLPASYYFEYGPTTAYGSKTTAVELASGNGETSVNQPVSNLEPGKIIHYRIVATNSNGSERGGDESFQTPDGTASKLASLPLVQSFSGSPGSIAEFSTDWTALSFESSGQFNKGEINALGGWRPVNAFPTNNGARYKAVYPSTSNSPWAAAITLAASPGINERYFSLWTDVQTNQKSWVIGGYWLRFTLTSSNVYQVTLNRLQANEVVTPLASQSGLALPVGSSLALVDQGGVVEVWTNTGSGFTKRLSAADATFSSGKVAVSGAGNITRIVNLKVGGL